MFVIRLIKYVNTLCFYLLSGVIIYYMTFLCSICLICFPEKNGFPLFRWFVQFAFPFVWVPARDAPTAGSRCRYCSGERTSPLRLQCVMSYDALLISVLRKKSQICVHLCNLWSFILRRHGVTSLRLAFLFVWTSEPRPYGWFPFPLVNNHFDSLFA